MDGRDGTCGFGKFCGLSIILAIFLGSSFEPLNIVRDYFCLVGIFGLLNYPSIDCPILLLDTTTTKQDSLFHVGAPAGF